jgi:GAF domain
MAWAALNNGLVAAEAASPVEAVEAVTRELGQALGALQVSALVADLSGRALVRLAHVRLGSADGAAGASPAGPGERRAGEECATLLPFDGGPAEQVVRTQRVQVLCPDAARTSTDGSRTWLVLAPVSERGEVIGLLELRLPKEPKAGRRASRHQTTYPRASVHAPWSTQGLSAAISVLTCGDCE